MKKWIIIPLVLAGLYILYYIIHYENQTIYYAVHEKQSINFTPYSFIIHHEIYKPEGDRTQFRMEIFSLKRIHEDSIQTFTLKEKSNIVKVLLLKSEGKATFSFQDFLIAIKCSLILLSFGIVFTFLLKKPKSLSFFFLALFSWFFSIQIIADVFIPSHDYLPCLHVDNRYDDALQYYIEQTHNFSLGSSCADSIVPGFSNFYVTIPLDMIIYFVIRYLFMKKHRV